MDSHSTLLANGAIYIDDNTIVAVSAHDAPAPAGFSNAATVKIKGTIFPGFIELHNHLSYDSLQMWTVPKKFTQPAINGRTTPTTPPRYPRPWA